MVPDGSADASPLRGWSALRSLLASVLTVRCAGCAAPGAPICPTCRFALLGRPPRRPGVLVAVPFMAGFLGAEHAIVVMQIPGLVSNAWLVWSHRRAGRAAPLRYDMILPACVMTIVGVWFLDVMDDRVVILLLAGAVACFLALLLLGGTLLAGGPVLFAVGLLLGRTGLLFLTTLARLAATTATAAAAPLAGPRSGAVLLGALLGSLLAAGRAGRRNRRHRGWARVADLRFLAVRGRGAGRVGRAGVAGGPLPCRARAVVHV